MKFKHTPYPAGAFKTVVANSDPMDVDSVGKGGEKDKNGNKQSGKGQNQRQNQNPSKVAVSWQCGEKRRLSTECWSNPKKSVWLQTITKEVNEKRITAQARSRF